MVDSTFLSQRVRALQPSATVAVSQRARELKSEGKDVLSFSVGEPDFGTPEHICRAAKAAVDAGHTRYTAVRGVPELLAAICQDSERRRPGAAYKPDEVVVSVGAKHTLFNLSFALFDEGDEVIVPAPHWVSYPEQIKLTGATPVVLETSAENRFCLSPAQLEAAISDKTKALILCTPSNPTGAAYREEELRALADVLVAHPHVLVIVDEIYSQLVYDGFVSRSLVELCPALRDRVIIVDGVSKSHAMTGWRIGWMLGPAPIAKACERLQSQATTNPTAIAQYAALEALQGPQEGIAQMIKAFETRRNLFVEGLRAIEGIHCGVPQGAFYVFASVSGLYGKRTPGGQTLESDLDVAKYFLERAECALVPGIAFGAPGYVRVSYAVSEEVIREGLRRIKESVDALS